MNGPLSGLGTPVQDGKFGLPEDGFVQFFPFGEWPGVVEFGDEKPEDVPDVVQDAEGKWYLDIVQVLDREASEACRNSFARDALIDYEHESDEPSGSTRAGGWAEEVATRNDGHYGRIRWSADGLRDVTGGMFRYLSPVFPWRDLEHLGANRYRPKSYTKIALTNSPRLKGIKAVSNSAVRNYDPSQDRDPAGKWTGGGGSSAPGGGGDHESIMKAHDEAIKKAKGAEKTKAMQAKLDYMTDRRRKAEADIEATKARRDAVAEKHAAVQAEIDQAKAHLEVAKAPKRISASEADALLSQGIAERDPDGNEVRFGKRLADYLATKDPKDAAKRKVHLEWARDAVRTTKPIHPEGMHDRVVYAKKFRDENGAVKGIVTIAGKEIEGFEVFNLYRKAPGKIPNSEVRQSGGLSPRRASQVYAIAGNLFGDFNITPAETDVNPLDPRVGSTGTAPEQAEREKEKKTMREQMIQALGLPPETTDEQLVAAVGDMKKRLDEINAREQEAQVENDLKTYGDRVQDPKVLKDALAKNRDAILPVLKVLKPAAPAQALNTAKTKTPAEGPTAANRAKEQERAVEDYRVKNKCSRREAWAAMRREKPELFAKED
jgi:phage I-like protein